MAASQAGKRAILLPRANASEATLVGGIDVLPVDHLSQAVRYLRGECLLDEATAAAGETAAELADDELDLTDIRGQQLPKHALELAAAGGHNLLLKGSPGGGKTMLARRLPGILPPLTHRESLEVTRIYSVAGLLPDDAGIITQRPFRAPHLSVSTAGLIGGGSLVPHPGEVSLAHRGVLFLDEAAEFKRDGLQALRGPLEEGTVTIVRGRWAVTYPARFQLVAATNPCPCGYRDDPIRSCKCLPGRLAFYDERLSGPVMDRIDLQVHVERLKKKELFMHPAGDTTLAVRERVVRARRRQAERLARFGVETNADIPTASLEDAVAADTPAIRALENSVDRLGLSARGVHRVMRVARTVADLAGDETVGGDHVELALRFRFDPKK
jgi:magnesium chelatase family protein